MERRNIFSIFEPFQAGQTFTRGVRVEAQLFY